MLLPKLNFRSTRQAHAEMFSHPCPPNRATVCGSCWSWASRRAFLVCDRGPDPNRADTTPSGHPLPVGAKRHIEHNIGGASQWVGDELAGVMRKHLQRQDHEL
jgi:hypothetical protein